MKIETKFGIGEIVYLLNDSNIATGKIVEIYLSEAGTIYKIDTEYTKSGGWYDVFKQDPLIIVYRSDDKIGRTKQELLELL